MALRNILFIIFVMLVCTGCGVKLTGEGASTAAPDFVTSTLPPSAPPLATQTPIAQQSIAPTAMATHLPAEGITNTQVNIRAATSTASTSFGMIGAFETVQVLGKDASGSWYQIMYAGSPNGNGWVRAEYVQVNDAGKILPVEGLTGNGGLVLEAVNLRSGPGSDFESLGVLSSKDAVLVTGKDPSGAWVQVEVTGAENLKGWVTVKFLQVENLEAIPVIGEIASPTSLPAKEVSTAIPPASQDGDSLQSPLTVVRFSSTGSRAVQIQGNVSAPAGDTEDWIQFSTGGNGVVIEALCSSDTLTIELWFDGQRKDGFSQICGEKQFVTVEPNGKYVLRILETSTNQFRNTDFILTIEDIHQP